MSTFSVYRITIGALSVAPEIVGLCSSKPDQSLRSFIVEYYLNQSKPVPKIRELSLPANLMGYALADGHVFYCHRSNL